MKKIYFYYKNINYYPNIMKNSRGRPIKYLNDSERLESIRKSKNKYKMKQKIQVANNPPLIDTTIITELKNISMKKARLKYKLLNNLDKIASYSNDYVIIFVSEINKYVGKNKYNNILNSFFYFLYINNFTLYKFFDKYEKLSINYLNLKYSNTNNQFLTSNVNFIDKDTVELIESMENLSLGLSNEHTCYELYEEKNGSKIIERQRTANKKYKLDKYNIQIKGRIDGIDVSNGHIVELKTRINHLTSLNKPRTYEEPQIQMYMHILKIKNGIIFENLINTDKTNTIMVRYNNYYVMDILDQLIIFLDRYFTFITNKIKLDEFIKAEYDEKIKILLGDIFKGENN